MPAISGDRFRCTGRRWPARRHRWAFVEIEATPRPGGLVGGKAEAQCRACGARDPGITFASTAELLAMGIPLSDLVRNSLGLPAPRRAGWRRIDVGAVVTAIGVFAGIGIVTLFVVGAVRTVLNHQAKACATTLAAGVPRAIVVERSTNATYFRVVLEDGRSFECGVEDGLVLPCEGEPVRICEREHLHRATSTEPKEGENP